MARYFYTYEANQKWHYLILQLMEGSAGASSVVYDSRVNNRNGYETQDDARKAGLVNKATMTSN